MKNDKKVNADVKHNKSNKIPQIIINYHSELIKTQLFHLLFEELPTYDDLINKTAKLRPEFELELTE